MLLDLKNNRDLLVKLKNLYDSRNNLYRKMKRYYEGNTDAKYNYETTVIEYNLGNETKKFNLLEGTYLYAVMLISQIADGDILAVRHQIKNTYELAIDVGGKVVYADIVKREVEKGYFDDKYNLLKALQDNINYVTLNLPDYID